jgi:hypothetical protein
VSREQVRGQAVDHGADDRGAEAHSAKVPGGQLTLTLEPTSVFVISGR